MTTPDFEGIMPYGMTFKPTAGSSYVGKPASSSQHISGPGLALPSAPVTVSASWTGPEECGVYLSRNGVLANIGTIPAKSGGGPFSRRCSVRRSRGRLRLPLLSTSLERRRKPNRHHHRYSRRNVASQAVA